MCGSSPGFRPVAGCPIPPSRRPTSIPARRPLSCRSAQHCANQHRRANSRGTPSPRTPGEDGSTGFCPARTVPNHSLLPAPHWKTGRRRSAHRERAAPSAKACPARADRRPRVRHALGAPRPTSTLRPPDYVEVTRAPESTNHESAGKAGQHPPTTPTKPRRTTRHRGTLREPWKEGGPRRSLRSFRHRNNVLRSAARRSLVRRIGLLFPGPTTERTPAAIFAFGDEPGLDTER